MNLEMVQNEMIQNKKQDLIMEVGVPNGTLVTSAHWMGRATPPNFMTSYMTRTLQTGFWDTPRIVTYCKEAYTSDL